MKQLLIILLLFIGTGIFASCHSKNDYNTYQLRVDLQSSFNNDDVEVLLDGQSFYKGTITSGPVIALTASQTANYPSGNHSIKVIVNNTVIKNEQFSLTKNLFLGVSYYRTTQKININCSDVEFTYL